MAKHGENIRKRRDGRWEGRYIKDADRTAQLFGDMSIPGVTKMYAKCCLLAKQRAHTM